MTAARSERWRAAVDALLARLRTRRRELGVTTYQLAERAGCTQSTVSASLTARHLPNSFTLARLADVLEMDLVLVPRATAGAVGDHRPESRCHCCGGPNPIWSAPSPLWNAVMRGGSISNADEFDGIVCPTCFARLAETRGIAGPTWRFFPDEVHTQLELTTPDGRVWDEKLWLWVDPPDARTLCACVGRAGCYCRPNE